MSSKKGLFATLMVLAFTLCLTSPTHKRSPIDGIEEVSANDLNSVEDAFMNGTKITQRAISLVKNNLKYLNELIEDANDNIKKIRHASDRIGLKNVQVTNAFLEHYYSSRADLRKARRECRKLAQKTVTACKNIKQLIENWDDKSTVYIEKQFSIMKELLKESASILKQAKENYNKAITAIDKSSLELHKFEKTVTRMTRENTAEYKAWSKQVRDAAYGTNGGVSVAFLIADFLGCFGLCSTIGNAATWSATVAGVESTIANHKSELQRLVRISNGILKNIEDLDKNVDETITALGREINIIITWETAAENVNSKIAQFSIEKLKKFAVFQQIFVRGIDELENAAQSFLDLNTNLYDEEEEK